MKKMISCILLAAMLVVQLGGCGRKEDTESLQGTEGTEVSGVPEPEEAGGAGSELSVEPGGILDPSAAQSRAKDNTLDAYQAAMKVPLPVETPENERGRWGEKAFLGGSRAYHFIKHTMSSANEDWDELSFVTAEGEEGSESFDWDHTIWDIGQVAGTDHYIALGLEKREDGKSYYFFSERDENHEKLGEFPLDCVGEYTGDVVGKEFSDFAVDVSGTAHVLWSTVEGTQYLLVSQEGEILAECALGSKFFSVKLVPLYDGRIALWSIAKEKDEGMTLQHMDRETGGLTILAAWKQPEGTPDYMRPYYATLLDEKTLVYADWEGVYRSGLSGEALEVLYEWGNHGIRAAGVSAIQAGGEGKIRLIYEDSDGYHYMCLEPVTEKVEMCEITMAVPSSQMDAYRGAVVEFHKRYPGCHIELVEYAYRDTALLTQLSAGKGPVLIDTFLLNFEELEKLWEPLDTVMEQLGIMEGLLPSVMEMGKINGKLYGMVASFSLQTMVVNDPDLKDWDYDAFMQCIEDSQGLESIFDINYGGNYGSYFISYILSHGLGDSYFLDEETGKMVFDSDKFRKALELGKKYCVQDEEIPIVSALQEGKVLCDKLNIYKPEHVGLYRICYGEDVNYIGYPTKDGGTHFLLADSMLSIRRSATKEEKEYAAAFINLYLSYEGQSQAAKELNFDLSVHEDVLEEQIASMNAGMRVGVSGIEQIKFGSDLDIEQDRKTLLDLISQAKPRKAFPSELQEIMNEELEAYFEGEITEDMLIDHLESRVGLYQGERE